MTGSAGKFRAFITDIFLPNRCPFCGKFITWDRLACEQCDKTVPRANDKICRHCGKRSCICGSDINYDMAFASFFYNEEPVRNSIYRFKTIGDTNIAEYAAEDIASFMEKENIPKPDMIIPVPMGRKKRRKRGFNQAELFASCIGKRLDTPVNKNILYKIDTKDEQHNYGRDVREKRVKGLFMAEEADLSGMTVMICDDVMTTGATINECSRLLKELGAGYVISAVCAVTELNNKTS